MKETPRAVSIVTREQMDDRASVSIADALQYTPSIQANFYGEDNKQDWFVIRGFKQANNGLYRDGTRVYSYGFYSWQLDPFCPGTCRNYAWPGFCFVWADSSGRRD